MGDEQPIGVPQFENGIGITQAKAAFSAVEEWEKVGRIQFMGFDTPAINANRLRETCILL